MKLPPRPPLIQANPRPPRRLWRWVRRGALACAVLAALLAGPFWWFYLRDEPPPDDADLLARNAAVPDGQNGFVQIQKLPRASLDLYRFARSQGMAEAELDDLITKQNPGDALVDAYLAETQPILAQADTIATLPHFDFAGELELQNAAAPLEPLLNLAKTLQLSSAHARQKGDWATAARDAIRLHNWAGLIARGQVPAIVLLTASVIDGFSAEAGNALNVPALPAAERDAVAKTWSVPIDWMGGQQRSLALEYQFFRHLEDELKHERNPFRLLGMSTPGERFVIDPDSDPGSPGHPWLSSFIGTEIFSWSLQLNTTRREAAEYVRNYLRAFTPTFSAKNFPANQRASSSYDIQNGASPSVREMLIPNFGGRIVLENFMPSANPATNTSPYLATASDRLIQTSFALRHYYDDHRTLPSTLAALVPEYLPAVPVDPFDGQPLRYDPARGLIYSVGTDLKDNGGSKSVDLPHEAKEYPDPLTDQHQPTLVLRFQNSAPAATP